MEKLELDRVMELAAEAVERMGADHVSPMYTYASFGVPTDTVDPYRTLSSQCRYVSPKGEAGCIVGQVLHAHGVSLEVLSTHEGENSETLIKAISVAVPVSREANDALSNLQRLQDAGMPWGIILEHYNGTGGIHTLLRDWEDNAL